MAVATVAIVIVVVVVVVLGGGRSYQVHALFENASQIVSGDEVEVAGNGIGTVSNISLTPNGQANLTLNITNPTYQPLFQGTLATVRAVSLTGIANRYVDLRLPPAGAPKIPSGGTIPTRNTTSAVDFDQLFNTLNAPTRKSIQNLIQGSALEYEGEGKLANTGWQYLNPAVASSSMLFAELNKNTTQFTKFIVQTANLVSDISTRSTDLSGVISHLSTTTQALASQRTALGQSIQRLPNFLALADTTFVDLRTALDDLTPLVNDTKPVAPKLRTLLEQLKPLAQDAVPTVRDLSKIVSKPGANNDLTDLVKLAVPLAASTVKPVNVDGKVRPGAFPQSTTALSQSTPEVSIARPYAVDLTGWFEGYSHPGFSEATGIDNRVEVDVNAFSDQTGTLSLLNPLFQTLSSSGLLVSGQGDRCPGSMERGGLFYPESGVPCTPSEVPTGP
ncbi:MAG TPA: MlaD family protein [Solirubrobacteraceae bacterium]|nr:MlaD family protein [Solirubrobacteraceae bacterium]